MEVLPNCLEKIDEIQAYTYTWIDEAREGEGLQYGVNADEVQELNEGLVCMGENGFKSVNYNGIVGLLLGAIKELKEEVAQLKSK